MYFYVLINVTAWHFEYFWAPFSINPATTCLMENIVYLPQTPRVWFQGAKKENLPFREPICMAHPKLYSAFGTAISKG